MRRKDFLKKGLVGVAGIAAGTALASGKKTQIVDVVGFNHIPLDESSTENTVLHRASTRGSADHGWLNTHHTFSFANYYNPERMNFGALRVLNDDIVAGGKGFRTHPHENMEIVSIPLSGDLKHKDSMGNEQVIRQGDIQVMSAGSGIYHSEFNKNSEQDVKFLQIWLFPNRKDVAPRYDQISLNPADRVNKWQQILSPYSNDEGVWIHQNAWFHMTRLEQGKSLTYNLKNPSNGAYLFVLSGEVKIADKVLNTRDGFGIWDVDFLDLESSESSELLLMEVPMT